MQVAASTTVTPALKSLFWDVFFKARQRGTTLERHFPWIDEGGRSHVFFEASKNDAVIGGLALQSRSAVIDGCARRIGLIGLVCVEEAQRGCGVAGAMVAEAIAWARVQHYDALTLWTSQHRVYERHGFRLSDPWRFGTVQLRRDAPQAGEHAGFDSQSWVENKQLPLPPFAESVHEFTSEEGGITVLADRRGWIVASYSGPARSVADTIARNFPPQFRLNASAGDPLPALLAEAGAQVEMAPANLQMWLPLNTAVVVDDLSSQVIIPILERI